MGNEDKIKKEHDIEYGKKLFLPKKFVDPEGKRDLYSLDDEFSRSKKNRRVFLPIFVASFLTLIILGTLLLTNYIQNQQRKIDVSIDDIKDLNLMELLDKSKHYEMRLRKLRNELELIRTEMSKKLQEADNADTRKVLMDKYTSRINNKKEEITSLEKEMKKYNKKLRKSVKKADSIVDNYKKLHQIKMNEQKKYYESRIWSTIYKYNPRFRTSKLRRIVSAGVTYPLKGKPTMREYKKLFIREKALAEKTYTLMQQNILHRSLLVGRLLKVPYINSIDPALKRIDTYSRFIVDEYERLCFNLASVINKKNSIIKNYKYAFNYLTRKNPEGGYIIDARNSKGIILYINRVYKVREGTIGTVFRSDDEYVGKIRFVAGQDGFRAEIVEIAKGKKILPFDKILLEVKK